MTTLAFDTHKFIKELTGSGMPDAQAEVLANHYISLLTDRLATKEDIALSDKATKAEIERLEEFTKAEIDRLEASFARLEASTKAEIERLEVWTKAELTALEERMDAKLLALEERLLSKINITILSAQLVSVIATCTIIAFLLNLQ